VRSEAAFENRSLGLNTMPPGGANQIIVRGAAGLFAGGKGISDPWSTKKRKRSAGKTRSSLALRHCPWKIHHPRLGASARPFKPKRSDGPSLKNHFCCRVLMVTDVEVAGRDHDRRKSTMVWNRLREATSNPIIAAGGIKTRRENFRRGEKNGNGCCRRGMAHLYKRPAPLIQRIRSRAFGKKLSKRVKKNKTQNTRS